MKTAPTYSTFDVCRIAGTTFRQIDYWIRAGYVTCTNAMAGSGNHRRWSPDELARVVTLTRLERLVGFIDRDALEVLDSGGRWLLVTAPFGRRHYQAIDGTASDWSLLAEITGAVIVRIATPKEIGAVR